MPEIQLAVAVFSMQQIILKNVMASAFPLEQLLWGFWQIKNDTLTGNFGFVGNKMAFTIGKLTEIKSHFITYKSNENTSYLNTKLIKTVTVNVHKSDGNRKYSYEKENVVKDSGEGRCFLQLGDAMGAAKNIVLEPLASALGVAAFLHNVIIVHPLVLLDAGYLFMHYNATLCKEALGKKLLA